MNMRLKFPHYLQHDTMDCGPVCIRMIAKYYGLESRTPYNIYVSIVF